MGLLAGCGPSHPPTYPVRGTVAFADGRPVTWGTVEFYSVEQKIAARGQIQSDGSFQLSTFGTGDGAVAGRHLVTVAQAAQIDRPLKHEHAPATSVPPRYANPKSSGLEFTVEARKKNEFKIAIGP
jgi:hypothetical protein